MNQESQTTTNIQCFLDSTRVLRETLVTSILRRVPYRPRDDDTFDATKVRIVDLDIQNLTGDVGDDGVRRGKVNPWADVCDICVDSSTGEEACVFGRQGWKDGIRMRGVCSGGGSFSSIVEL